jgi:hypothetical protein
MKNLIIKKTDDTPSVIFDKEEGVFEIIGKSLSSDAIGFYEPILKRKKEYLENPNHKTMLKLELIYFSTASSKMFFEMVQ